MFNKYITENNTRVTPVTRVIEKTITPNKVTEMYDKVRAQAERDMIQVFKIQSNTLNGVVLELHNQYDTLTKKIMTRFSLNGKEYIDTFVDDINALSLTKEGAFKKLAAHYEKVVADSLLYEAMIITASKLP